MYTDRHICKTKKVKTKINNMLQLDFAELLEKEMDRKDFLLHIGIILLAITGLPSLLKSLKQHPPSAQTIPQATQLVQSRAYGGARPHS